MHYTKAIIPLAALAASLASAGAQTIVNGGFESPILAGNGYYSPGSSTLTGWDIVGPSTSLVEQNVAGYVGTFGTQAIDLTGSSTSGCGIEQLISGLVPGQSYSICFDVWNFSGFTGNSTQVQMIGSAAQTYQYAAGLQSVMYNFTAVDTAQRLQFLDVSGLDANAWIDNIQFCIPEPGSMGLLGMAALGGLVLRRRRA